MPSDRRCDGYNDCADGQDEENCGKTINETKAMLVMPVVRHFGKTFKTESLIHDKACFLSIFFVLAVPFSDHLVSCENQKCSNNNNTTTNNNYNNDNNN